MYANAFYWLGILYSTGVRKFLQCPLTVNFFLNCTWGKCFIWHKLGKKTKNLLFLVYYTVFVLFKFEVISFWCGMNTEMYSQCKHPGLLTAEVVNQSYLIYKWFLQYCVFVLILFFQIEELENYFWLSTKPHKCS